MKLTKLLCTLVVSLSAAACVNGTRQIELDVPSSNSVSEKSGLIYIASINDSRVFKHKPRKPETPSISGKLDKKTPEELSTFIGRQRNGYGGAVGSVALKEGSTVQQEARKVLTAGLEARGYQVSDSADNARAINIDIQKFWAWMVPGFISIGFESEVELGLESGGKTALAYGKGNNEGQVASNANWALTYKRAYQNLLDQLDAALEELDL